jgi:hypothetical protein
MPSRRDRIRRTARTANPICLIVPAVIAAVAASTLVAVHTGISAIVVAQLAAMGRALANLL